MNKYDVYFAHTYQDAVLVDTICTRLEKLTSLKACPRYVRGRKDLHMPSHIKNGILESKTIAIFVTNRYLVSSQKQCMVSFNDEWDDFELQEIFKKTNKFGRNMVMVIPSETSTLFPDILNPFRRIQEVVYCGDMIPTDEWIRMFGDEIIRSSSVNLDTISKESIGYWMATEFCRGFLNFALSKFEERCNEIVKDNFPNSQMVKKLIIIVPQSCYCSPTLEVPNKIETTGKFLVMSANRSGSVARDYKTSIYKIILESGSHCYFAGEMPTQIMTLYEEYKDGRITLDQFKYGRNLFFTAIQNMLLHSCIFVLWDDRVDINGKMLTSLYDLLSQIILKECPELIQEERLDFEVTATTTTHVAASPLFEDQKALSEATTLFHTLNVSGSNPASIYEKMEFGEYERNTTKFQGKCLIINIYAFHRDADAVKTNKLLHRKGGEQDSILLKNLFTSLNFDVMIFENVNKETMTGILNDFSTSVDHSDYKFFACIIMSHGRLGEVFTSDGLSYRILDIADFFSGRRCKTLLGKPKMFFIQACQGPAIHDTVQHAESLVPGDPYFLMSYSTLPGIISYRDSRLGTLYIQALVNQLSKPNELDRALRLVTREVKTELEKKRQRDKQDYQFQLPFHLTTGIEKMIYLK